ncbi:MAG: hydantoinase B/oxoprolinase family protein [Thiotrichales bacterium]|nr:hydantoinase B/oxoprolinase family protein [Thiotrichales bacterium]
MNSIELTLFHQRLDAICDEMGLTLQRAAFSPNIKDRLDYSCAIFDRYGSLRAQAAHIPVHLGSMAYAMADLVKRFDWQEGDMVWVNDPFLGGTHLPDITVIAPVFIDDTLCGFVANRAHHADIGAESAGSMPIASRLLQEGVVIAPTRFMKNGAPEEDVIAPVLKQLRNPDHGRADLIAQASANVVGCKRLTVLVKQLGSLEKYYSALEALNDYGRRMARSGIGAIPNGDYQFTDVMDDDGQGNRDIAVSLQLKIDDDAVIADFSGSALQVVGNINCPVSVVAAAVYYAFRCLMPANTPACAGSFSSISLVVPYGSFLNPEPGAAVAAGNVETSMRLVDVVMGALAQALPDKLPAASQGTMNNVALGSVGDVGSNKAAVAWDYYETLAGGAGAGPNGDGASGIQLHMTNTQNTPVESVEMHYPLRISRYQLISQRGTEAGDENVGGRGLIREYEFLQDTQVTLLTERRTRPPWGLHGAKAGKEGENKLDDELLPGKTSLIAKAGQRLSIQTPSGGNWRLPKGL